MNDIKTYAGLVEFCKDYRGIIVAGPQRSGTTFTSKALAKSLGYQEVDEFQLPKGKPYVWQFAAKTHKLQDSGSHDLVIWMNRPKEDVQASEKRIGWNYFEAHKKQYIDTFGKEALSFDNNYDMKHHFWNNVQKDLMTTDFVEFDYDNLSDAPGYLEKDKRKKFSSKQTC